MAVTAPAGSARHSNPGPGTLSPASELDCYRCLVCGARMPVRTRSASQAAQLPQPLSLLSLSDDLLLHCLSHLSQQERFQHASMVCKRFRELCLAPQLLHSIQFHPRADASVLPGLAGLRSFMAVHGRQVERLVVDITVAPLSDIDDDQLDADAAPDTSEAEQLLHGSLEVCGGEGSCMQVLDVTWDGDLDTDPWLAGLTALQRLKLASENGAIFMPEAISRLQSLLEMEVSAYYLYWSEVGRLPASLQRLCWSNDASEQLPAGLPQLTALSRLEIIHSLCSSEGMMPLTTLTSLRTLRLPYILDSFYMPAWLSALTWLEQLVIYDERRSIEDDLDAALPSLQHLTCLSLWSAEYQRLPLALGGLSRLQRLCLHGNPRIALHPQDPSVDFSLPQGPWLASIRWLGLPWEVLEVSAEILCNAPCLEYLCVLFGMDSPDIPPDHPLWALAATHPLLRCLGFVLSDENEAPDCFTLFADHPPIASAIEALKRSRPGLRLLYMQYASEFEKELLDCDTFPGDGV